MFHRICLWSHLVLNFCLLEAILISFDFSTYWSICIFYFSFSLGRLYLLWICPLRRNGQIHKHIVACNSSYDPLYLHGVSCSFIFISNFIDFEPSPFFCWWVWLKVYQFFYFFKEPTSHWSFLLFSSTLFYISALIFMISFLLLIWVCLLYSFQLL